MQIVASPAVVTINTKLSECNELEFTGRVEIVRHK
nr:MAG TPA: hypothetical protein [Caudoviricetes sp.]